MICRRTHVAAIYIHVYIYIDRLYTGTLFYGIASNMQLVMAEFEFVPVKKLLM